MTDTLKSTATPRAPIETLSFERAMQELDTLVSTMDQGQLPLDQMLEAYERAGRLCQHCEQLLASAKLRISKIEDLVSEKTVSAKPPVDPSQEV